MEKIVDHLIAGASVAYEQWIGLQYFAHAVGAVQTTAIIVGFVLGIPWLSIQIGKSLS